MALFGVRIFPGSWYRFTVSAGTFVDPKITASPCAKFDLSTYIYKWFDLYNSMSVWSEMNRGITDQRIPLRKNQ